VLWLTDPQGMNSVTVWPSRCAISGASASCCLTTRTNRNRSKIPTWFIETLTASAGMRSPQIKGLAKGSEQRYGFIHLGGAKNRVALIGAHGTSLYIDFDQRLVIAALRHLPESRQPGTARHAGAILEKRRAG
jgi:hypothetical protein